MLCRIYTDATHETEYCPVAKQLEFHRSLSKVRLLSGGVGAGKTTTGAVEALRMMLQYPGSRGLIGRFTEPELRSTSWYEFRNILPDELIDYENRAALDIRLKNGSEVMARHLQDEMKIRSLNLGWAWVDEATEIRESVYRQLEGRLRHPRGPRRMWLTTNPDTRSSYLYRNFIAKRLKGHAAFHIRSSEASFLPPDYLAHLYETWDDEMVQKLLEGRWDAFEGLVFPMFDREQHVIPWQKSDVPKDWPRFRVIDPGWSDPCAVVWFAVGPEPDCAIVAYQTYYRKHRTVREIVEEIKEMSAGEKYEYTLIDPRADVTQALSGRRMSEEFGRAGLPVTTPKRQNILPGIARLRNLMEVRAGYKHLTLDQNRAPRFYVSAFCLPLIRELFDYRYPPDGGETPIDKANHTLDCCFAAGTLIMTSEGEVPIEYVRCGMMVYTRKGLRQVVARGMTNPAAKVIRVNFSDGRFLMGTPNHPVWSTSERKFVCLERLGFGIIEVWNPYEQARLSLSSTEASNTVATLTASDGRTGHITLPAKEESTASTARFGETISALFRKAITSTTRMATRITTIWETWNASRRRSMAQGTPGNLSRNGSEQGSKETCRTSRLLTRNGETLPPGRLSSRAKERLSGLTRLSETASAITAAEAIRRGQRETRPGFAATAAKSQLDALRELISKNDHAGPVAEHFPYGNMPLPDAAPVSALGFSDVGVKPVYNLEVDECPEYYANGVLVHNCRFLVMHNPQYQEKDAEDPWAAHVEKMKEMFGVRKGEPWDSTIGNESAVLH